MSYEDILDRENVMLAIRRWIFEMIERYSLWYRAPPSRDEPDFTILPDDPITVTRWK